MQGEDTRFLSIDDLVNDQGEIALTIEYDSATQNALVEACAPLEDNTTWDDIMAAYIALCDSASPTFTSFFLLNIPDSTNSVSPTPVRTSLERRPYISFADVKTPLVIFVGKKYKPVALKVQPVETELLSQFRIIRKIKGDPLENLPTLPTQSPDFKPTG